MFLISSWGSWEAVVATAGIRKGFTTKDVEDAFRMALLYCVNTYQGDDKIRSFIWDLITPVEHGGGQDKVAKNHSGLSGPIPRGKRGLGRQKPAKPAKEEGVVELNVPEGIAWVADDKYDMEEHLDKSYRKHLDKQVNKLLLRIRMLFYINYEILDGIRDKCRDTSVNARSVLQHKLKVEYVV